MYTTLFSNIVKPLCVCLLCVCFSRIPSMIGWLGRRLFAGCVFVFVVLSFCYWFAWWSSDVAWLVFTCMRIRQCAHWLVLQTSYFFARWCVCMCLRVSGVALLYESPGGNQFDGLPPALHYLFNVIANFDFSFDVYCNESCLPGLFETITVGKKCTPDKILWMCLILGSISGRSSMCYQRTQSSLENY